MPARFKPTGASRDPTSVPPSAPLSQFAFPTTPKQSISFASTRIYNSLKDQIKTTVDEASFVPPPPDVFSVRPRHVHTKVKPFKVSLKHRNHIIFPKYKKQPLGPLAPVSQGLYSSTLLSDEFPDNVSVGTWTYRAVNVLFFFLLPVLTSPKAFPFGSSEAPFFPESYFVIRRDVLSKSYVSRSLFIVIELQIGGFP